MTLAIVTLTVAQLLDLGTFVRMIAMHGATAEVNPLVAHALAEGGLPLAAVAKIAALSVAVAVTVVLAGRTDRPAHPRLAGAVIGAAVIAGLVGGLSNAAVLVPHVAAMLRF